MIDSIFHDRYKSDSGIIYIFLLIASTLMSHFLRLFRGNRLSTDGNT
jgi:hypothetical protein